MMLSASAFRKTHVSVHRFTPAWPVCSPSLSGSWSPFLRYLPWPPPWPQSPSPLVWAPVITSSLAVWLVPFMPYPPQLILQKDLQTWIWAYPAPLILQMGKLGLREVPMLLGLGRFWTSGLWQPRMRAAPSGPGTPLRWGEDQLWVERVRILVGFADVMSWLNRPRTGQGWGVGDEQGGPPACSLSFSQHTRLAVSGVSPPPTRLGCRGKVGRQSLFWDHYHGLPWWLNW